MNQLIWTSEGEQGKKYASAIEKIVNVVDGSLAELSTGGRDAVSAYSWYPCIHAYAHPFLIFRVGSCAIHEDKDEAA